MKKLIVALLFLATPAYAQRGNSESTKAQQEFARALTSGTLFGVPRYTTALRPTCNASQTGAVIFNTTTSTVQDCDGSAWGNVGGGDVTGPASSTDNALPRFDGTGGKTLQGSDAILDDSENLSGIATLTLNNGGALRTTTTSGQTVLLQAYDNDTGPGYITFGTLTAGNTPTFNLAAGVTINSQNIAYGDASGNALTGDSATAFFSAGALEVTIGGTGAAPGADDQLLVSDSTSAATWRAVADCDDTGGNHLNYDTATNAFSCGTSSSSTAAGGDGAVQYNNGGSALGGVEADFFFDDTTNARYLRLGSGTGPGAIRLLEGSGGGTSYAALTTDAALAGNLTYTFGANATFPGGLTLGSSALTLTKTGDTETVTFLVADASGLARTWTFPNPGGDTSFAHIGSTAQTFAGNVTISTLLELGGSTIGTLRGEGAQTPDAPMLLTGTLANSWIVAEVGDRTFDFAHALQTNPTLFVHSASQSTTQWISFTHDQTNGVIDAGAGDIVLNDNVSTPAHYKGTGTAPAVSVCGTTPSITGSDVAGKVTAGGGGAVTSCTVTFATAYAAAPACVVNNETTSQVMTAATSTTVLTITGVDFQSDVISYLCVEGS